MDRVLEILREELELYKQENIFAQERLDSIKFEETAKLEEVIKKEQKLTLQLENLERERVQLLKEMNIDKMDVFIETVSDQVKKETLKNLKRELLEIAGEIQVKNDVSTKLVEVSAEIFKGVIEDLTGKKDIGYKRDLNKTKMTQNSLWNKKI